MTVENRAGLITQSAESSGMEPGHSVLAAIRHGI